MQSIPQYRGDTGMLLSGLALNFRAFALARGASPKTVESYDLTYNQFLAYLIGRGLTDDVRSFTPENIEGFCTYLAEHKRKASTVIVKLAALHSLAEYGVKTKDGRDRYILSENPLKRVYRPKRVRPAERYLGLAELRQLLAVPCPAPVKLALDLLLDTAARASEVAGANVGDLRLDGERVILTLKTKGNRSEEVTLGTVVAGRLLESLRFREAKGDEPLLVNERGERYSRTTLSEMVLRMAKKAGITRIKVRAHVLRHSMATLASAMGADVPAVAAMLHHADLSTVSRYIHRRDAVDSAREATRRALHNP